MAGRSLAGALSFSGTPPPIMAANDLTTIAALKLWLGISASTDDVALGALITAASGDFLQRCNRASLVTNSYAERYDGQGSCRLLLRNYPVTAVSSVQIGAVTVPQSTDYQMDGWVFDRFGISLIGAYWFWPGVQNVAVTYTAGYASVPPEVSQAVNSMCASWWRRRQWTDQTSKNLAGEVVAFRKEDISPEAQRVVDQYTRRVPL